MTALTDVLEQFRSSLLALKPEGDDGLEGLVAHALAASMSRQFRVARAGRQHGRDGASTPGAFDVFFEAKLYAGKPPSTESLQAKLMSAVNSHQPMLDLWVLAATTPLGENSIPELVMTGERFSVTVVGLDWSAHPLPPLAVLFASTKPAVIEWLDAHLPANEVAAIGGMLDVIASHPLFDAAVSELATSLSGGTSGFGAARARNAEWLESKFANRVKARQAFGQFIAPTDVSFPSLPRLSEVQKIAAALKDRENQIIAITGDEGTGKTWLPALAWTSLTERPVFLLCTTDMPILDAAQIDPIRFLAQLLIDQTGGVSSDEALERWTRRLENWGRRSDSAERIWLILDGLNERESRKWIAIIDKLMMLGPGLGIRLFITSRPAFFDERIRTRLSGYKVKQIPIDPFSKSEVIEGLKLYGAKSEGLPDEIIEFLRNPRIFSIALSLLDRLSTDELTRERLLFEYWRRRIDERASLRHSDAEMRQLLISHARVVRNHLQLEQAPSVISFRRELWKDHSGLARRVSDPTIDDELSEVESGAFFAPDPDEHGNYRLRPEGFAYALGLSLIDEVRNLAGDEIVARIDAAIDPIRGLDQIADVLLAALGIACIDERVSLSVGAGIFHSLIGLQNLPDAAVHAILPYVTARPGVFIEAAEMQFATLGRGRARHDWIRWLLFQRRDHNDVRPFLDTAIRRWLGYWCRVPDRFPRHGLTEDQLRQTEQAEQERATRVIERLASLTPSERLFLDTYCHEVATIGLTAIDALAVSLLAGRALAPFSDAIVAWHLANAMTSRTYSATHAGEDIDWCLRLNPVDALTAPYSLRNSIARLESPQPSETGLWARIGTLRGTGRQEDAKAAEALAGQLKTPEEYKSWRRIDNFCDADPLDPGAPHPTNLDNAIKRIESFDVSALRKGMGRTAEDYDLDELTPALARFSPEILVAKLRSFACDLINRSGTDARFLGFDLVEFTALLSPAEMTIMQAAYAKYIASVEAQNDSDQQIGAQYILRALLPHLGAEDQLDALLALPDYKTEMLMLKEHFKAIEPESLGWRLEKAEKDNGLSSLRRTLFFACANDRPLSELARAVVGRCFTHGDPVIRLLAFNAAAERRDESLLSDLAKGGWDTIKASDVHTESFYGSMALARAPKQYQTPNTLMRMSLGWQASVIDEWGTECIELHADIIIEQVRNSRGLPAEIAPQVDVQRNLSSTDQPDQFSFFDAKSRRLKSDNSLAALHAMASNSPADAKAEFDRRQGAIKAYLEQLRAHNADRLVDSIYVRSLAAIARFAPKRFESLVTLIRSADEAHLPKLCNIAACAAVVLSRADAEGGAALLARIATSSPDIQLTIGSAAIPFHQLALWMLEDSVMAKAMRLERIKTAADDAALLTEATSASYAGKLPALLDIIQYLTSEDHPGAVARGLTLAGYCDENDVSARILSDAKYDVGFLKRVARIALAAYERNIWARHWYDKARTSGDNVDWWRFTELMISAADSRFVLWFNPEEHFATEELRQFAEFARERMKKRAKEKRDKRAKVLFGVSPPSEDVLSAIQDASNISFRERNLAA